MVCPRCGYSRSYAQRGSGFKNAMARAFAHEMVKTRGRDLQLFTGDVCGDYCLYFCKCFTRMNRSAPELVFKHFSDDDKRSNDELVWEVVHEEFPRILNSIKHVTETDASVENYISKYHKRGTIDCKYCNQGCCARSIK